VGFKNASKRQAEEIFLRMFIDLSTSSSLRGMEEASASSTATEDEKAKDEFGLPNGTDTTRVRGLAKDFAALVPEGDFSPADLQDYLLIHKKDPQKAVDEAKSWMEKAHEERQRRDEEQKEQKEVWREEKRKERDRFREEVKAAVMGLSSGKDEAKKGGEGDDTTKEGGKDLAPENQDGKSEDKTKDGDKDMKSDEKDGTAESEK
jgi:chaperone BCS1